ncbi:predicted protein [Streptomyces viridosporus ATCC 14672]|uniref:Uncharacterized protein n=2 Tax=Streptomyces viridosporus TaxID=67581 RepID=A0ABX6AMK2_STRVD|nr:predicted protein [Streptomyces viridosporus ATCC 14672]QEU88253.1 hypothetical protein CP969_28865 [Streptomyces viridosporus T7A]
MGGRPSTRFPGRLLDHPRAGDVETVRGDGTDAASTARYVLGPPGRPPPCDEAVDRSTRLTSLGTHRALHVM